MRCVEAGNLASAAAGLTGRRTNSPPQFGHLPLSFVSAHSRQKVHSNEQIIASADSGDRSRSHASQFGFKISINSSSGSLFQFQQRTLSAQSSAVSRETSVRADDSMAWDND